MQFEDIMYQECVRCPKLDSHKQNKTCDGPNFFALSPDELIVWCKERKKHLGLTNAKLAETAGMAQGTVDNLLAKTHTDFKYGTIRPVLNVLVGGWSGNPCPDPENKVDAQLKEEISRLQKEIELKDDTIKWQDDKIRHFKTENVRILEDLSARVSRHHDNNEFLRAEIKRKNKIIAALVAVCAVFLIVIIAALVVDRSDPTKGFFWLTSWINLGKSLFMNA